LGEGVFMLSQDLANDLIKIEKKKIDNTIYEFPDRGNKLKVPIISIDEEHRFLIDVVRGNIKLKQITYQERYQKEITLVRLDIEGSPHTNPSVAEVPFEFLEPYNSRFFDCPHLHLYVEGYDDKWAIPVPENYFGNINDMYETLMDFLVTVM